MKSSSILDSIGHSSYACPEETTFTFMLDHGNSLISSGSSRENKKRYSNWFLKNSPSLNGVISDDELRSINFLIHYVKKLDMGVIFCNILRIHYSAYAYFYSLYKNLSILSIQ